MDARAGLIAVVVAGACGGAPPCGPRVLARGTLAYDAVLAGDAVIAIELDTRFALIVHDAVTGAVRETIELGGPTPDLTALAVDPARRRGYVGGRDQAVRAIDLDRGAVIATWPLGADVTALAADGTYVAIGDATGVVCLRRARDGALLQCLAEDGSGPIARLAIDPAPGPAQLVVRAGDVERRYALPSLAAAGRTRVAWDPPWTPPLRLGGAIRSVHATPDGTVVAAWVRRLDDPSIVLIPHGCPR